MNRLLPLTLVCFTATCLCPALPPPCVAQGDANPDATAGEKAELKERFGEQQFKPHGGFILTVGQKLPDLVWTHPELVEQVVDDPKIPTRWFNEDFEEVQTAGNPGRHYVYGEAPVPSGVPLRRAMTCYCVVEGLALEALAKKQIESAHDGVIADSEQVTSMILHWNSTEEGVVELAAILEDDQTTGRVRVGQWQMENATQHVRLKRKLLGLDNEPIVKATVRPKQGKPAPELRKAPLEQAEITEEQVREIEAKLDQWYENSKEPMAVVIARNGVIVAAKGYGTVDDEVVTVDTPMLLHSAMKPLIGLQLAMYVDQGFIMLDESIGNYLSDFNSPQDRNLTFRAGHVHATGIHFPWALAFSRLFYFHTWHECLIAHCKREWAPGTKYRYGVVGVILSVRALELLRGRNYWDAMERDLFQPLGIRNVLPGGTGFSAENMARIGVVLANHGSYGSQEVISEETYAAIVPTPLNPFFPALNMQYGIGFQDHTQQLGSGSFGHGGGCGTLLSVNPDKHLVFAMVRNGRGHDYNKYRTEVLALLRNWIQE